MNQSIKFLLIRKRGFLLYKIVVVPRYKKLKTSCFVKDLGFYSKMGDIIFFFFNFKYFYDYLQYSLLTNKKLFKLLRFLQ